MNYTMIRRERANILLFSAGKSVSIMGTAIYSFAIGLYVLKLTGSAFNFATTLVLSFLPMIILSPIAGVIADRFPKKWLVVGFDAANGILFFSLYFISAQESLSLLAVYISTVLLNVFTTFFGIGLEAVKPDLVTPEKLVRLNTVGKLIDSSAAILGPMIGGVIYAFVDIRLFILLNGISFLLSALSEWFIQYDFQQDSSAKSSRPIENGNFQTALMEGVQYLTGSKKLMELVLVFASLNFLLGFSVNVPAPYIINEVLKLSPDAYGIISATFPVGLILGTLTVERLMKRFSYRGLLISMNACIAAIACLVGLPLLLPTRIAEFGYIAFYGTMHFTIGVAIAYVDVPMISLMQREIPDLLRGRVLSLLMSFVKAVLPIALLVSGFLVKVLPIALIPLLGGSVVLVFSLSLLQRGRNVLHCKQD